MAAGIKFYSLWENIGEKKIDLSSDTLILALSNVAPSLSNTQLSDITQISYTNVSSRTLTSVVWAQSLGVCTLTAADLTITASGTVPEFRYPILYSDTSTGDLLLCYWDIGVPVNLTTGQPYLFDLTGPIITQS